MITTAQQLRAEAARTRICLPFVRGKPERELIGRLLFHMDNAAHEVELLQAKLDAVLDRVDQNK